MNMCLILKALILNLKVASHQIWLISAAHVNQRDGQRRVFSLKITCLIQLNDVFLSSH